MTATSLLPLAGLTSGTFSGFYADTGQSFDLVTLGRNLVNGLTFGSIYALVALGIVLIYKSSDVVNFGHGEMGMFSTFICYAILGALLPPRQSINEPLPDTVNMGLFVLALILTLVFGGALGMVIQQALLRPLQKATVLSQIMVTIGLGTLFYGLASFFWKADEKKFPVAEIIDGPPAFRIGDSVTGIPITREMLAALLIDFVVCLALYFFFNRTMTGIAIRALAQNPTAAKLMGINISWLTSMTWMIALMLAAVAGILVAPKTSLSPIMMADVAVKSFGAAVLGGMTSLTGAVIGGLLIGIIDNFVIFYLPSGLSGISTFLIIVLVLTIRPNGLLGQTIRKKV